MDRVVKGSKDLLRDSKQMGKLKGSSRMELAKLDSNLSRDKDNPKIRIKTNSNHRVKKRKPWLTLRDN